MDYIDKFRKGSTQYAIVGNPPYGNCSTAANVAAKTVTLNPEITALYDGLLIAVKMYYGNSAANPTLNVNGLGAKPIVVKWDTPPGTTSPYTWTGGQTLLFRLTTMNSALYWEQLTQPRQAAATIYSDGLMSAADKSKLDGLGSGTETATLNTNKVTTGYCRYMLVGKLVVVTFDGIEFKAGGAHGDTIASNVPTAKAGINRYGILVGKTAGAAPVTVTIGGGGNTIMNQYSSISSDTPSGMGYYGTLIYEAN